MKFSRIYRGNMYPLSLFFSSNAAHQTQEFQFVQNFPFLLFPLLFFHICIHTYIVYIFFILFFFFFQCCVYSLEVAGGKSRRKAAMYYKTFSTTSTHCLSLSLILFFSRIFLFHVSTSKVYSIHIPPPHGKLYTLYYQKLFPLWKNS